MRASTSVSPHDGSVTRLVAVPSACGNLAYSNRKMAKAAAARQSGNTGETIRAYHCPWGCHAWHIGHPPGSKP